MKRQFVVTRTILKTKIPELLGSWLQTLSKRCVHKKKLLSSYLLTDIASLTF